MRANAKRVYEDLPAIVERLRAGDPQSRIMREYRVGYETLRAAAMTVMSADELAAAARLARKMHSTGGRFQKGHVSWTTGRKGLRIPGSERGWFLPGAIRGAAARHYRAVGTIRVRADHPTRRQRRGGRKPSAANRPHRRYIKIRDDGPPGRQWVAYARWLWESANGGLPAGLVVVHLDGDAMNDDPSNLGAATRAQALALLMKLRPDVAKLRRKKSASAQRRLKGVTRIRHAGRAIGVWDCSGCGASYYQPDRPERCPKCGGGAFEPRPAGRLAG